MAIKWWSLDPTILFLCWWFLCSFNPATCFENDTDRLALISFRRSIQQDPFGVLSSWNDSFHFCHWQGVSCGRKHPDRVTSLNLNSQRLGGPLSPHIGNLSFLRHLDFQNNSFYGEIPQQIGHLRRLRYLELSNNSFQGNIPTNLSQCSKLTYLNLIDNKLEGKIPDELGSLLKLEGLGLAINNLTGSIPPSIGNLSFLQVISLRRSGLQGQIPQEISQLQSLTTLIFGENNLVGNIPRGLFNISNLENIEVHTNQLNGSIPSDIGITLPKLSNLQISDNQFTGPIPYSLSNASTLWQIAFEYNGFSGSIPRDFGKLSYLQFVNFAFNPLQGDSSFIDSLANCSSLSVLDLRFNSLKGTVPISIANLSKDMYFLSVADNQLHGPIPSAIENLINLRFFLFGGNYLSGSLLVDFGKFPQLQLLDLGSNKFTGRIPSSIGNLSLLSSLYMGQNKLHGSIPPSLGGCHNLIALELFHNFLTGSIPRQVIGLRSLSVSLNLAANSLTGPIPSDVGLLQTLAQLDLSDNRLSGVIPNDIGKCVGLEQLHLQGNSFEGEIPPKLSALQGLRELDVSRNNLSGRISSTLAELDGLKFLNMSFNQLQGEVPKRGVFLNASAVSLLGNNGLCGGITELKLPSCLVPNSRNKHISFALKVIIPVFVVLFFVLMICSLIFLRCKRISRKKNLSMPSFQNQFLRISYADLFKATDGFSMANMIGVGSYGSVYKGIVEHLGMEVAVKVLNLQQRGASNSFMHECQALRTIRHRNLVKLLSVCSSIDFQGNDFKALVYEFMANGSLDKWLHTEIERENGQESQSIRCLKLMDRINVAIDIATAIEYLHNGSSSTIIHGDLKPSNVLLDEEMTAHIGDFGLAKIVSSISGEIQQNQSNSTAIIKGSIGYVPPEYGMGDPVSVRGDVYSYGILLLEMFTGKRPTDDYFSDDFDLHTFVNRVLPYKVMDIVDPRLLLEERGESFKDFFLSTFTVGVACSMKQPGERMQMRDAISELLKIKSSYMKQDQRSDAHHKYGGPSTSQF